MKLSELTAYAEEKFHIQEQHKWADFPGFSVLVDPGTEKWAALLMRQWDTMSGTEIQRCDIKCGREILSGSRLPFLSLPFRMKGPKWVGVTFDETTDPEVVFRLFDKAVYGGQKQGFTIVLDESDPKKRELRFDAVQKGMKIPDGAGKIYKDTALPPRTDVSRQRPERPAENRRLHGETGLHQLPAPDLQLDEPLIPEKILEMRRLYEYGSNSFTRRVRNFYRQGKFMEDYEDNAPWDGQFRHYFPSYHDLNIRQLRGYFTWRTRLRKGDFRPITTSLAYMYLYELMCGIGTASPEDTLEKMEAFRAGFVDSGIGDPSMKKNLCRWMMEYAVLFGLPPETARKYADPAILEKDKSLCILKEPEEKTDEELFSALKAFAGKKFDQSPVIKEYEEKGKHLFAELWRTASQRHFESGQDLFTVCFGEPKSYPWHPLENAIFYREERPEDTEYILDPCRRFLCRGGNWREERYENLFFDREKFQGLLREGDRQFRKYLKTGHALRAKPEEAWAFSIAEAVIEADRRAEIEAARPKITIDLSGLEKIRKDALVTRDSLLTEADLDDMMETKTGLASAQPLAEKTEEKKDISVMSSGPEKTTDMSAADHCSGLDDLHYEILLALLQNRSAAELIKDNHLMPSVLTDTINEALFDEIGDSILECDGDTITVVEDYREDVLEILQGDS